MACKLELAWKAGYRKIVLESDSLLSIATIKDGTENSPHLNLKKQNRGWIDKDGEWNVRHVWKEGNASVDCLSKLCLSLEPGLKML